MQYGLVMNSRDSWRARSLAAGVIWAIQYVAFKVNIVIIIIFMNLGFETKLAIIKYPEWAVL